MILKQLCVTNDGCERGFYFVGQIAYNLFVIINVPVDGLRHQIKVMGQLTDFILPLNGQLKGNGFLSHKLCRFIQPFNGRGNSLGNQKHNHGCDKSLYQAQSKENIQLHVAGFIYIR